MSWCLLCRKEGETALPLRNLRTKYKRKRADIQQGYVAKGSQSPAPTAPSVVSPTLLLVNCSKSSPTPPRPQLAGRGDAVQGPRLPIAQRPHLLSSSRASSSDATSPAVICSVLSRPPSALAKSSQSCTGHLAEPFVSTKHLFPKCYC